MEKFCVSSSWFMEKKIYGKKDVSNPKTYFILGLIENSYMKFELKFNFCFWTSNKQKQKIIHSIKREKSVDGQKIKIKYKTKAGRRWNQTNKWKKVNKIYSKIIETK